MHIIHVASELAPHAKIGGLGDVIQGLSKEFHRIGHHVEVFLPKYDTLDTTNIENFRNTEKPFTSFEGPYAINNQLWEGTDEGVRLLFIDPEHPDAYFSRGSIYGEKDDAKRFCYFSKAILEYLYKQGKPIDVLHIHDWQASLMIPLYHHMYKDLGLKIKKIVFTIHNLDYQGICSKKMLSDLGVPKIEKIEDPDHPQRINLLRGALEYADEITTVSPTYEKEILTEEGGKNLYPILKKNKHKLHGILNGIDDTFWNPLTDPNLISHYDPSKYKTAQDLQDIIQKKHRNRTSLNRHLNLSLDSRPLIAAVTRLVPQKGPDLIMHALFRTLELNGQFVLLGTTPLPSIEKDFMKLQKKLKSNPHAAICLNQNEAFAHLIFAAADMIVIPSIFEPCGLTQLIGMRYGAVPIARKTGGLADTVFDINSPYPETKKNGFTFEETNHLGIQNALERALSIHADSPTQWKKVIQNGLRRDSSWKRPAKEYLKLYTKKAA